MKKILTAIFAIAGVVTMGNAQAEMEVSPYLRLGLGYSIISDVEQSGNTQQADIYADDSSVYGIAGGVTLNKKHDIELEWLMSKHDIDGAKVGGVKYNDTGDIKVSSYMVNYRFNFMVENKCRPYLLAGLGYKTADIQDNYTNGDSWSDKDSALAYQAGFGCKYFFTKNILADASYRYQDSKNFDIDGDKANFTNHNILIGIAYQW